jgi:hypothetical protein
VADELSVADDSSELLFVEPFSGSSELSPVGSSAVFWLLLSASLPELSSDPLSESLDSLLSLELSSDSMPSFLL